ncbi:MAG: DUF5615 family PIN-like protein [Hyphomonadaceae bacterium]
MNFLVDANLPDALVRLLWDENTNAVYVDDVLPAASPDDAIWELARTQAMVIVSKDSDFAMRALREHTVQVVWIRCGNLKLKVFEAWFASRMQAMRRLLESGEHLVELR